MTEHDTRTTIRETDGLWTIVVTAGGNTWSRHARTSARADQIARDLERLAAAMMPGRTQ